MDRGCVTLGELHGHGVERLVLACERCRRCGSYRVGRLVEIHGAAMGLPDLRRVLTARCGGQQGGSDAGGTRRQGLSLCATMRALLRG